LIAYLQASVPFLTSFCLPFSQLLCFRPPCRELGIQFLRTHFLGFGVVNVFNQNGLVLEVAFTFATEVEGVVQVSVNLLHFPVLLQQSSEDPLSSHPQDFARHSGLSSTFPLSKTHVSTLLLCVSVTFLTEG
jgi:hypothetical protein